MSRKNALSGESTENHSRTLGKLPLSTAGVGDQRGWRQCWRQFFEQRQDSANRRREHDDIAVPDCLLDIRTAAINRTARYCGLQHFGPVATDDRSLKSMLSKRKTERAADQPCSHNRDL